MRLSVALTVQDCGARPIVPAPIPPPSGTMTFVNRVVDAITLGSEHPIRRLIGFYAVLAIFVTAIALLFPNVLNVLFRDVVVQTVATPVVLEDGLATPGASQTVAGMAPLLELLLLVTVSLFGVIVLMLPVTWVYMAAREVRGHNPAIVQTLLILPIVVAGVVFVVRNSLALAFSLAGVVAAVRFRTTLRDTRDIVFIFLAIGVGFSAGVFMVGLGALVSIFFNFVVILSWRYGFGRNVLTPTAATQWRDPLSSLARQNGATPVPDRDVLLALSPDKVEALADRFKRVRSMVGSGKRPRFNAVVSISTDSPNLAQPLVEAALTLSTRRWVLDEVSSTPGKPSEMYYLVKLGKTGTRDDVITAVRARAGEHVLTVDLQLADFAVNAKEPAA